MQFVVVVVVTTLPPYHTVSTDFILHSVLRFVDTFRFVRCCCCSTIPTFVDFTFVVVSVVLRLFPLLLLLLLFHCCCYCSFCCFVDLLFDVIVEFCCYVLFYLFLLRYIRCCCSIDLHFIPDCSFYDLMTIHSVHLHFYTLLFVCSTLLPILFIVDVLLCCLFDLLLFIVVIVR